MRRRCRSTRSRRRGSCGEKSWREFRGASGFAGVRPSVGGCGGPCRGPHHDSERRHAPAGGGEEFTFFVDGQPLPACAGEDCLPPRCSRRARTLRRTAKRDEPQRPLLCMESAGSARSSSTADRRACTKPASPGLTVETGASPRVIETDLAIVGAGHGRLAAAGEALARGSTVTLLETIRCRASVFPSTPTALTRAAHAADDADHRRARALFARSSRRVSGVLSNAVCGSPGGGGWHSPVGVNPGGCVRARSSSPPARSSARCRSGMDAAGCADGGRRAESDQEPAHSAGPRFLVVATAAAAGRCNVDRSCGRTVVEVARAPRWPARWRHAPALLSAPTVLRRGLAYRSTLARPGPDAIRRDDRRSTRRRHRERGAARTDRCRRQCDRARTHTSPSIRSSPASV